VSSHIRHGCTFSSKLSPMAVPMIVWFVSDDSGPMLNKFSVCKSSHIVIPGRERMLISTEMAF
jgi:hypothetical protein